MVTTKKIVSVKTIEILGAALEEACLKKGEFFSEELHPIL
jgi:hypothetical protein